MPIPSGAAKESYHLCVNTTHREIKQLVPALAQFCKDWFACRVSFLHKGDAL